MKCRTGLLCILFVLMCCVSVSAETEIELSTSEEFSEWINSDTSVMSTLSFVRRVAVIEGTEKISYFTIMQIDGQLVYCIEPNIYAGIGLDYRIDWSTLSEEKKQRLFHLTNVGYLNYGHDEDKWFVATQLAIWRALGFTQYSAKTFDNAAMDLSDEVAEIERMADSFALRASFSGQTLELDLGVPRVITDHNGVLARFQVQDQKGLKLRQNGNELEITIVDPDFTSVLSDSVGITTGGLVYGHSKHQKVYMVHRSQPPVSYELALKLKKGDVKITKLDSHGLYAEGEHVFEVQSEEGKTVLEDIVIHNGQWKMEDALPSGRYVLKEKSTVFPYQLSNQSVSFQVDTQKETELVFVNEFELIPVQILKKDSETLELLDGAEFVIQKFSDGTWEEIARETTKQGIIEVNGLRYHDEIKVCEVKAPEGYRLSEQRCQTKVLSDEQNEATVFEFENDKRMMKLRILKKDEKTGELLNGAHFVISRYDEQLQQWIEWKHAVTGMRTAVLDQKFFNEEIRVFADEAYQHELTGIEVDESGTVDVSEIEMETVYFLDKHGNRWSQDVLILDGLAEVEGEYGQKLRVCEVRAPEGYEQSDQCQEIELTGDTGDVELVVENRLREIEVVIVKRDKQSGELLNDAFITVEHSERIFGITGRFTLKLYDALNKPVSVPFEVYRDPSCTELLFQAETNQEGEYIGICDEDVVYVKVNGQIIEKKLPKGGFSAGKVNYGEQLTVCEVAAPSGYQLQSECETIEIKTQEEVYTYYLDNEKIQCYKEVPSMGTK